MTAAEGLIHDRRLDHIVEGLGRPVGPQRCDADWRLVWVSPQTRALIGQDDKSDLGLGRHVLESRQLPAWQRMVSRDAQEAWIRLNVPQMLADDPDGRERLAAMVVPELRSAVEEARPAELPIWTWLTRTTGVVQAVNEVRNFGIRVRTKDGESLATVYVYGANLPATLLALVAQGDRGMFERMARLAEPGRHEAAVLFADIQGSGELSRHLSSGAYFRLLQKLFTDVDAAIIDASGIVGKHAGDGVSAFLNVGVHWGGALFMGQVVTGGRLEVTALGDEVNECARIQEAARDGTVLASKPLIERLDPDHARSVGIDPDAVAYSTVAELTGATGKAVRDAGSVPVTEVPPAPE